jgi:hypothetical protein
MGLGADDACQSEIVGPLDLLNWSRITTVKESESKQKRVEVLLSRCKLLETRSSILHG